MKFDVTVFPTDLNQAGALARAVEDYGFAGLWTSETAHNPFLPLTHAAAHTQRIDLGTAIAVAFPRSPMVTAQIAWNLAAQSNGRFILGLGTQVKAHIVRRFSTEWGAPAPRLREYVLALRAIWDSFQNNTPLSYQGEHYQFSLMTPFFSPGRIATPDVPVYIAGVNEVLCRVAGEIADGFHVHPFHTDAYLRDVILPNVAQGAERASRARADCALTCAVFVVTGSNPDEMTSSAAAVKAQIAFYASTPSYRAVLDHHGWGDLADTLGVLARRGAWAEMGDQISDEMLHAVATVAPTGELAAAVRQRYTGLLDRVGYYFPFEPSEPDKAALWQDASRVFGA